MKELYKRDWSVYNFAFSAAAMILTVIIGLCIFELYNINLFDTSFNDLVVIEFGIMAINGVIMLLHTFIKEDKKRLKEEQLEKQKKEE
jgi:hypothetical protein